MNGPAELLNTKRRATASTWDHLLTLQTEYFLPVELKYLLSSVVWEQARTIADIGCGNGYYLSRIAAMFSDKAFSGIDISPELIELAKSSQTRINIQFQQSNFLQYYPDLKYDAVLMRLVIQHMNDISGVLNHAAKIIRPGGGLFIIEPELSASRFLPALPVFLELIIGYEEYTAEQNLNRTKLGGIGAIVDASPKWSGYKETISSRCAIGPFKNHALFEIFNAWIDLIEQARIVHLPIKQARAELDEWKINPNTFTELAIKTIEIERSNVI